MTRHRNWNNFRHFNVNRHLHGLTHWEKSCSYLGYSDCQDQGQVGSMLFFFAILLTLFRTTKKSAKRIDRSRPSKIKIKVYVKVYIVSPEKEKNKTHFAKLYTFTMFVVALLIIGLKLFGGIATLYGTPGDTMMTSTCPNLFCSSSQTSGIVNSINATIGNNFQSETLSICSNLSYMFKVFLMLLLLCGDIEENPGPQSIDERLTPQLLRTLFWKDENGREHRLNMYKSLAASWKEIADLIGLDVYDSREIEKNYKDSEECIRNVFERWIMDSTKFKMYPCTWRGLMELLENSTHSALASEVRAAFGTLENLGNSDFKTSLLEDIWWEDETGRRQNIKIYDELRRNWDSVAFHIGLESHEVDRIRSKCMDDCKCLVLVFDAWRSKSDKYGGYECTWNGLRRLMESITDHRIKEAAKNLKCALLAKKSSFRIIDEDLTSHFESETRLMFIQLEDSEPGIKDQRPSGIKRFNSITTGKFERETEDIKLEFRKIKVNFKNFLLSLGPDKIHNLKSAINALMKSFSPLFIKPTLRLDDDLENMMCIREIFEFINNYCSFFSYKLLEHIFELSDYEEGKESLKKYEEKLIRYGQRQIYYFPSGMGIINESRAIIALKIDGHFQSSNCKMSHLVRFHDSICEILKVKVAQLPIDGIVTGCICINFHLPKQLKYKVFPLSTSQLELLKGIKLSEAHSITNISCENFQYDLKSSVIHKKPIGCIVILGRAGAGKTTQLNNIFDMDEVTRSSPKKEWRYLQTEDVTRNNTTFRIIYTPGLELHHIDVRQLNEEFKNAIGGVPVCILYCLPIAELDSSVWVPKTTISAADEIILENMHRLSLSDMWHKFVVLFTFTDTLDTDWNFEKLFRELGQSFHNKLTELGSNMRTVKNYLEYKTKERHTEDKAELVTIPVGRTKEQVVIAQEYLAENFDWTDVVFVEIMRKLPANVRREFVRARYGSGAFTASELFVGATVIGLGVFTGAALGSLAGGIFGAAAGGAGGGALAGVIVGLTIASVYIAISRAKNLQHQQMLSTVQ